METGLHQHAEVREKLEWPSCDAVRLVKGRSWGSWVVL